MLTLTSVLRSNFDYYNCDSTSDIPFFFLNMENILNFFEATISHIMPLIVNELNFATVCYSWKRETPWINWYIFLTLTLFIQFLLLSRLFHCQRIELCPRMDILQLESRVSATNVCILTYVDPIIVLLIPFTYNEFCLLFSFRISTLIAF